MANAATRAQAGVYAVADRLQPKIRDQWLAAVQRVQNKTKLAMLSRAIVERGLTTDVFRAIDTFGEELSTLVGTLGVVVERGAAAAEQQIAERIGISGMFNIVSPRAIEAARLEGARLIVEVTDQTKQAVRMVITRAMREGIPPREAAELIRPLVGLTERQAGAVFNYRGSLAAAGQATDRIGGLANTYAERLHRQRALLIARTETIRASNSGQQAAWEAAEESGLLTGVTEKRWSAAPSERTCPICRALDKQRIPLRGVFTSIKGQIDKPPAHPACRCRMVLLIGGKVAS